MATKFSPPSGSYVLNKFPSISHWSDTGPSWPSCFSLILIYTTHKSFLPSSVGSRVTAGSNFLWRYAKTPFHRAWHFSNFNSWLLLFSHNYRCMFSCNSLSNNNILDISTLKAVAVHKIQ